MDFHSKLDEDFASHQTYLSDNCIKPCMRNKETAFGTVSSTKGNFLQDFNHIDQFYIGESSPNHALNKQTASFDPFDVYPYKVFTDLDVYEDKPFAENGGHGLVMDNFQVEGSLMAVTTANMMNESGRSHMLGDYHQDIKPVNFVVPDEVSCISAGNGYYKKSLVNKSKASSSRRTRKRPHVIKGQWTTEEDRLLIQLVEQFGLRKWSHIAQMLPGRIGKQCRERWHNHLRPDIKKDTWSEEEDKILIRAHSEIGNKWAEIAKRLPGRTENSIKNHWNATKRRQYSKRKCRSKYPRASLLQDYIKSLNLSASAKNPRKSSAGSGDCAIVANDDDDASSSNPTSDEPRLEIMDFCSGDRLVPNFEFDEVPELSFDDKLFQEGCTIDSLLEDLPCPPDATHVSDEGYGMEMLDMDPLMEPDEEPKKDLDLVEMMSQVNTL
ncbi:hypothetical protein ACJRO7_009467 [Eucalyptus globulus]|uniref:Uncharacterized protein n=1 Tax=Eucalyptus globulus TaxID=34317 RepID=A0ABD3L8S1_EUCGL